MTFGSVCSGIEAASVAWHPLGWKTAWVSDIDPFASALLKHHYPGTHNYGDFTGITADAPAIDVLVGGTPCQSFSVAGLRGGLDDDRGNLALEYCRLADRLRPRWFVWENVPGVLSSNGGRDFGSILGAMGELGYGTAYRILDAQYAGVPQRRRRVFVVGYLGDWRRAAAVLFERHSLSGYPPPSRKAGQSFTHELAPSLTSSGRGVERCGESRGQDPVIAVPILEPGSRTGKSTDDIRAGSGIGDNGDPMFTLQSGKQHGVFASTGQTSHCLNAGGMGRIDYETETLVVGTLNGQHSASGVDDGIPLVTHSAVAFQSSQSGVREVEAHATLDSNNGSRRHNGVMQGSAVRRLTPLECERLQGFPDGYTAVPYRGKPAADGPRYKGLGNSMAVPVMAWIGKRIQMVENL